MKICPNCQGHCEDQSLFCENCGTKFPESTETTNAPIEEVNLTPNESNTYEETATDPLGTHIEKDSTTSAEDDPQNLQVNTGGNNANSSTEFCSHCGHLLEPNAKFCENCGHPTDGRIVSQPSMPSHVRAQNHSLQHQPMSRKTKIILVSIAVGVLLLFGLFQFGKNYYSEKNQMTRFVEIIKESDAEKLANVLKTDDPNYTISTKEIKNYTDYYQGAKHKKEFSRLVAALEAHPSSVSDITVKKEGKYFLLFDKYIFYMNPVYVKISANQKDIDFTLNGKDIGRSDSDDFQMDIGPLTPGEYIIEGNLKKENEKNTSDVSLVRFENEDFDSNQSISMNITKVSFMVESNSSVGQVMLDGKKIGDLSKGKFEVKDKVWHKGMNVQVVQKLSDNSELKTEKRKIGEDEFLSEDYDPEYYSATIQLDFTGIKDADDVQSDLNSMYSNFSSDTDDSYDFGGSQTTKLASFFENGTNNPDYQDFNTFITSIRKSNTKEHVDAEATVESATLVGDNVYDVQYLIEYKTVYSDYETPSITQVFRYKKATFVYDEDSNRMKIRSLGGSENFETVDNGS